MKTPQTVFYPTAEQLRKIEAIQRECCVDSPETVALGLLEFGLRYAKLSGIGLGAMIKSSIEPGTTPRVLAHCALARLITRGPGSGQ